MANLYRVLDWNWNATNSWATTSWGTGSVTTPTSSDNCYFDANSPTGTTTVNTTANCLDLDFTWYTGTFAWSSALNVYWNLTLWSWMTLTYSNILSMKATSWTKTITTNWKTVVSTFTIDWVWWTFQLSDNFSTTWNFRLTNWTFDANWKDFTLTSSTTRIFLWNITFFNLILLNWSAKTYIVSFWGNTTITNDLTINWDSTINRILISSDTKWTTRTITCNWTVTVTNADFQDITWAWTGDWDLSWITWLSWDCWWNSWITFTTPTTTTCSAWTTWSTATWSSRVPLPQDTATFSGSSRTITQDMPRIGSVDFTWSSGLTWTTSTACRVFGSIDLTDLATLTGSTQAYTFEWRWSNTLISAGKTWSKAFTIDSANGSLTLWDTLTTLATLNFTVTTWIFDTGWYDMSIWAFIGSGSGTRSIYLNNSYITLWRDASAWGVWTTTNLTFDAWTSTIKYTWTLTGNKDFQWWWLTYYDFWNATTWAFAVIITWSNIFNDFKTDWWRETRFTQSTTQTVNSFTSLSSSGNETILRSTTTTNAVLAKAGWWVIDLDYMNVDYITGSPVDTWYMWNNSTDWWHNTNIYFTTPPTPWASNSNFFLFF